VRPAHLDRATYEPLLGKGAAPTTLEDIRRPVFVLGGAKPMRSLLPLLALHVLVACARPCPVERPQASSDGGVAACVTSSDCMRPPATLLCASTEDRLRGCVDCVKSRCVEYVPEACP
jgi:hypothetical protein